MSSNDYLKFLVSRMVSYLDLPPEVRREERRNRKQSWSYHWFGMLPFSLKLFINKQKGRLRSG